MIHQFRTMDTGCDDRQFLGQLSDVMQQLMAGELSRSASLRPHQIGLDFRDNPLELTQMRNLYRLTHYQCDLFRDVYPYLIISNIKG